MGKEISPYLHTVEVVKEYGLGRLVECPWIFMGHGLLPSWTSGEFCSACAHNTSPTTSRVNVALELMIHVVVTEGRESAWLDHVEQ